MSSNRRFRTRYYPRLMYRYSAAGNTYQGERISFGARIGNSDSDVAGIGADPYPMGSTVEVFYGPADPANAVLERHPSWTPIYAGLGMLALAIALALLLHVIP